MEITENREREREQAVVVRQISNAEFEEKVPYPRQVKIIKSGNVTEVYLTDKPAPRRKSIEWIDENDYLVLSTGEIKTANKPAAAAGEDGAELVHRAMSPQSFKRSQANLRRIINANTTRSELCKWLTLTYDQRVCGLVRDPETVMVDFENFNRSLRRYLKKSGIEDYEYIAVVEPQRSGCWHLHVIQIWPDELEEAPYIPLDAYMAAWSRGAKRGTPGVQNGSVTLKACSCADNLGAYLSAYLGDAEVVEGEPAEAGPIKEVELVNPENGEIERKKFVKGARIHFYPAGMNLYRCSRGVKRPEESYVSPEKFWKMLPELGAETYRVSKHFSCPDFDKNMQYIQYNAKRKPDAAEPREDVSEKPKAKEEDVNAFLQSCPVCGEMHDDGQVLTIGGRRRYVCLGCAEKLERPGADVGAAERAGLRSDSGPAPSQGRSPRSAT